MVKQVRALKTTFYKNDDANGGAQNEAIKTNKEDEVIVNSVTKRWGRMWGNMTPNHFINSLEKNNGLYEVIHKFPHKMYFDIDKKAPFEDGFLDKIKQHILEYFPNAEMAISGSITTEKVSYHIVLQNYQIHNEDERLKIRHIVSHMNKVCDESFDWKVYTKNRNMKCINQSKEDGRVQTIIEDLNFKAHCITCWLPIYSLPFPEIKEEIIENIQIEKSKSTFDIGSLPKMILTLPEDFDIVTATHLDILKILPLNNSYDHNYTHLIARYAYNNEITFEEFLSWLERKHNPMTQQIISKWKIHWNNLHKFPKVDKYRIISLLSTFYPNIKKDIHLRKFAQSFVLPQDKIKKIETISQQTFECEEKYVIYNIGMGGGKTAQTINYLEKNNKFCWIAPNRALASNTQKRFEESNINTYHYESFTAKDKLKGELKKLDNIIICLNSLHYLEDKIYEVVVIDEIETLIDKIEGEFLNNQKRKSEIWNVFKNLLKNTKKVILLDAFITQKTLKFIEDLETSHYIIYERILEPVTRTVQFMNDYISMIVDIRIKLSEGLKLFIFYPYKNSVGDFPSMATLCDMLSVQTKKNGIYYNADVDDNIKKTLKDVNGNWTKYDFIITNNIVTCGVNYEKEDFDYTYIFIAKHNNPRDIAQVSYRIRHLSSGIINVAYLGKMEQQNVWLNDCYSMNCPIYTKTYNRILTERKAPIKASVQLFFKKAHFKIKTKKYEINEEVSKEIEDLLSKDLSISYNKIPDIDYTEVVRIEQSCFLQNATLLEKYSINKFYFKEAFINNTLPELNQIWDEKYLFFFQRLAIILKSDEKNLFNKIAKHNGSLFPFDINKYKLTDEHKEQIKKEFSFKYEAKGNNKLIQQIYNTYFGKHIIKTIYDENKNCKYFVDETIYDLLEFAKKNLILDKDTYYTYNNLLTDNIY